MEELTRKPSIEPPTSGQVRDTPEQRVRKSAREKIENARQMIILNFTLSTLSHIKIGTMQEFVKGFQKKPREIFYNIPTGMSFDAVLGIDPTSDKKTKAGSIIKICTKGLVQTVDRLWGQEPNLTTEPKESQIAGMCAQLEEEGMNKNKVLSIIDEHFGIQIPERPASVKAA